MCTPGKNWRKSNYSFFAFNKRSNEENFSKNIKKKKRGKREREKRMGNIFVQFVSFNNLIKAINLESRSYCYLQNKFDRSTCSSVVQQQASKASQTIEQSTIKRFQHNELAILSNTALR